MKTVIECQDIKRAYKSRTLMGKRLETQALNGLDFKVPKGTVFGLLGPNGSGKTTTIRILSTLLTPTSGKATVLGFDVVKDARQVRGRIGLILGGERGLYGRLTGEENLKYFAALNRLSRETARKRVKGLIEMVNLTEAAHRPVEQYSRGMRQRLHIARGLLTDPDVLFMDEPTIGLDPAGARELRQLIPAMLARGKTILLTTHYMSEADELSSTVAIINHGQIVVTGSPSDIKKKFSKINILEVTCRSYSESMLGQLKAIHGVVQINTVFDGLLQKVVFHVSQGMDIQTDVNNILGMENIKHTTLRDPNLEEAYLSIIK